MGQPQFGLMQMAYDHFLATAEWPALRHLQWLLDRERQQIEVETVVDDIPDELASVYMEHRERLRIYVAGLQVVHGADQDAASFLRLLALLGQRYVETEEPRVSNKDLVVIGVDGEIAERRLLLLVEGEYLFFGGGHSGPDGWEYEVPDRIRYFRGIESIDEYTERRRWYLRRSTPRRRLRPAGRMSVIGDEVQPNPDARARDFSFMRSARLRQIAERDYAELALVPPGSKAQVVLAGAIAEAVLLDALADVDANPDHELMGAPLGILAERARVSGLISNRAILPIPALREFRNLGHPGAELREGPIQASDGPVAAGLATLLMDEFIARAQGARGD